MFSHRQTIVAGFVISSLVGSVAGAADRQAFDTASFDKSLKSGGSILVEVHADWCPTCKAQDSALQSLEADPRFSKLKIFRVDFDSQKDAVRRFGARSQSTLIVFHKGAEVGRSVGETRPISILTLLEQAI